MPKTVPLGTRIRVMASPPADSGAPPTFAEDMHILLGKEFITIESYTDWDAVEDENGDRWALHSSWFTVVQPEDKTPPPNKTNILHKRLNIYD